MKVSLLFAAFALISSAAHAQTLPAGLATSGGFESVCKNTVTMLPDQPGWFYYTRPSFAVSADALFATEQIGAPGQGAFAIVKVATASPLETVELARFNEAVHDLAFHDGKIWVLFADHFVSIDAATGAVSAPVRTSDQSSVTEDSSAHAFAWVGDQLVIAHGTYGMTTFDHDLHLTHISTLGLKVGAQISKAIDVKALDTQTVVFAVEALTLDEKPPFTFNGLVTANVSGSNVHAFPYNANTSGSLKRARLLVDNGMIYINDWGLLQKVSVASLAANRSAEITWVPTTIKENGQVITVELLGEMLFDQGRIIGCANVAVQDPSTHKVMRTGRVFGL